MNISTTPMSLCHNTLFKCKKGIKVLKALNN